MKFHFGHGVAVTLTAFALLMAWFMYRAISTSEALVTEDYYGKELKFQDDIDMLERAAAHGEMVRMEITGQALHITFPPTLKGEPITGTLELMRPNDARADQLLSIEADTTGTCVLAAAGWPRGLYRARLDWRAKGEDHLTEQRLVVP